MPVYWPGGVRHIGDVSPVCGTCAERGKARFDTVCFPFLDEGVGDRENLNWLVARRGRVPLRDGLADRLVVVMKLL